MRRRPKITENQFDKWAQDLAKWVGESVSPFQNDTPSKKKDRIAHARKDKLYFLKTYLPHYFDCEFGKMHQEWTSYTDITDELVLLAAPREHGKSTFFTFGISLHDICFVLRYFIMIISDTNDQACEFTLPIRIELEENARLRSDFGEFRGRKWEAGDFTTAKGTRVLARGKRDRVRGRKNKKYRPDRVWVDDLENDENVLNPKLVEKSIIWLRGAVLGGLAVGYKAMMIGNLFHPQSVLSQLMDEKDENDQPLYVSKIYQAIVDNQPQWSERYTMAQLEKKKRQMGTYAFNKELMNLVVDPDAEIKAEWFRYYKRQHMEIDSLEIATFVDTSTTSNTKSDFKAIVTVGKDTEQNFYVLYAWIRRKPFPEMLEQLYRIHDAYGGVIGIEKNIFHDVWKDILIAEEKKRRKHLPIKLVLHHTNKYMRIITTLSWQLENGKVHIDASSSDQKILKEQILFLGNPKVADDGPDAMEGAVSLLNGGGKIAFRSTGRQRSSFLGGRYV
jgi:predicted phage terminase large subunit-like protein